MTYTSTSSSLAHVVSDIFKKIIQVTHSEVAMSNNAISITVFFFFSPLSAEEKTFGGEDWPFFFIIRPMYICLHRLEND